MPSDLTERLAFTLMNNSFGPDMARWTARWSAELLPLLLSEPELVAGLPEEVRRDLLRSLIEREVPTMECAFVDAAEVLSFAPDETRLSVLTPRERAELRMGRAYIEWVAANEAFDNDESHGPRNEVVARFLAAKTEYLAALAEARALTTEGKDG